MKARGDGTTLGVEWGVVWRVHVHLISSLHLQALRSALSHAIVVWGKFIISELSVMRVVRFYFWLDGILLAVACRRPSVTQRRVVGRRLPVPVRRKATQTPGWGARRGLLEAALKRGRRHNGMCWVQFEPGPSC
jgi:hypothetical protein